MLEVQVTVSLDSVSHKLYGKKKKKNIICKSVVLERYMRDHPERFIESNTENSWLRYLNDMCIQEGTWADALVVQAVTDALNVSIQIFESNPGFSPCQLLLLIQFRKEIAWPQLPQVILMNVTMHQPLPYNQMPPFQCIVNQQLIFNL